MRAHVWKYSNTTIDVLNKFRDLGAHINTIAAAESHVINDRFDETTQAMHSSIEYIYI